MVFFDLEDVTTSVAVMAGFLLCVGLLHLCRKWGRIWRVLLILVVVFTFSDSVEHFTRYAFHDLLRGTTFYRVFLATQVVYGIYAFKQFASEHVHAQEEKQKSL